MRFLVDTMLGKLAKWLRLLGYDVIYYRDLEDKELLALAHAEGRLLLTRDEELTRSSSGRCRSLLISSDDWREQLRELAERGIVRLRFEPREIFTRCLECNEPLERVSRAEVEGRVAPYLLETQKEFGRCPRCDRIYWKGTHFARALAEVQSLLDQKR